MIKTSCSTIVTDQFTDFFLSRAQYNYSVLIYVIKLTIVARFNFILRFIAPCIIGYSYVDGKIYFVVIDTRLLVSNSTVVTLQNAIDHMYII